MGIYAKTVDGWVSVGQSYAVAEGTPGAPNILNPDGGSVITFEAAPEGAAGPTLAHGASISPNDNGESVTVDQDNLEVSVSGTTVFTDYVVSIYGVNEAGRGETSTTNAFQLNYNEATGGDFMGEYTRLDDGTRWRYHKFTGSGTLTVTEDPQQFRVLVVGGGGGADWLQGSPGGYGGQVINGNYTLPATDNTVTIGGGGNGGQGNGEEGPGGNSVLGPLSAQGGAGKNSSGSKGGYTTQAQVTDDIDNIERKYSGRPTNASWGSYRGAGGYNSSGGTGPGGQSGIVIVAYEIGTSTTRQIQQTEAESAARQAGVEQGIQEGYSQAQDELQEEITNLRTRIEEESRNV